MDKFMQWFLSPAAYMVWVSLADATQWDDRTHTIRHKRSGLELWTSNGRFFLDVYEMNCIGYIDRHLLWRRARNVRKNKRRQEVINKLLKME